MPKLTKAERAILINQYRILAILEEQPTAYDKTINVLQSGYEMEYEDHVDGLYEPLGMEKCRYVIDVMWLYYLMKLTKNKVAMAEKSLPTDAGGRFHLENAEPRFPGFDGNHEGDLLSYARYMISDGKFPEHNHELNSHGGQPNYALMLEKWRGWGKPTEMSDEQVEELLGIRG